MVLRLDTAEHDVAELGRLSIARGKAAAILAGGAITEPVAPGHPDASAIAARMAIRGTDDQMPPLATEIVDDDGLATVRAWISGLRRLTARAVRRAPTDVASRLPPPVTGR